MQNRRTHLTLCSLVSSLCALAPAHAETITVQNENQLRAAAQMVANHDVDIVIDGTITVTRTVAFPDNHNVVRVLPARRGAGIHFAMIFDGDWTDVGAQTQNGVSLRGRRVIVTGLRFSGYNYPASALKCQVADELFEVSGCVFDGVGDRVFDLRPGGDATRIDSHITNQVISSHRQRSAHISVIGNAFTDCAKSAHDWSHCIYASSGTMTIAHNTFTRCGNPFAVGRPDLTDGLTIVGNRIIDAAASPNRGRGDAPAYLFKFEPTVPTIVAFNSVGGAHWPVYTGRYDTSLHSVFANDYSAAEFAPNRFAVRLGDGWLSWSDWRLMGFDAASLAPRINDPQPASRSSPEPISAEPISAQQNSPEPSSEE